MAALGDLKILKVAVDYWGREKHPLTVVPTFWRPKGNPPKDRWLTRDEAARLLRAAKPYQHMRRMILLGLHTGSRPGVILALRWDQVDFKTGVMQRLPRGATPDSKKRAPPVRLGRRIQGHLRRWKHLDGPETKYVCHFDGHAPLDPHTSWRKIIQAGGSARRNPPYAAAHTGNVVGHRPLGGRRLPGNDGKNTRGGLWPPPSRPSGAGRQYLGYLNHGTVMQGNYRSVSYPACFHASMPPARCAS
jgi:integrase